MNKRFFFSLLCGLAVASAPARAEVTTVSPWHTAGNGNYTDIGGGWFHVPNVGIQHQAKAAFGAGPVTGQMVIHGLGFSDLQGISYTEWPVASVSIQPVGGWTGGVSFHGFDLGVSGAPRDVDYEIWNGDFSSLLASGTVAVGAVHATINVKLYSLNGFNLQFESDGVVGLDNYRVEGGDSAAPKPSISLTGNGAVIPNGDTTPTPADHTAFGSPAILGGSVTRTFTIANTGDLALNLTGIAPDFVTLTGSSDFTIITQPTTPVAAAGGTSTFAIHFTPSGLGLKTATVSVANDDATKNPHTFDISGYWLGFSDGTVDRNFASNGFVRSDFGGNHHEYGRAVAVQTDGKIVVAGHATIGGNFLIALARYQNSGAPDPGFGSGGLVTTDLGPLHTFGEEARAVAVQPDGRILVGGYTWNGANYDFLLLRYTTVGTLDGSFGTGGVVVTPVGGGDDFAHAMVLQPDGRIVLAGHINNGTDYDVALVRYTDTGALDPGFGTGGKVVTQGGINSTDLVSSVALQSNEQIVVGGASFNGSGYNFTLLRYNPGGSLDGIFGAGGWVVTPLSAADDKALAVRVQPDGKILLAGEVTNAGNSDFAVARYSNFGVLDPGFGTGGVVITPVGAGNDHGRGMVLQSDGKILVAGSAGIGATSDFALVRYTSTGALDPDFGTGGKLTTALSPSNDQGHAVALLPDNRIVVAGEANNIAGDSDFAVAVYGLPLPNIAVAQAAALTDGAGGVVIGTAALGTSSPPLTFTITNPGNAELTNLAVISIGPDAGDFTVSPPSATSIPVGTDTATFTVTLSSATSGSKTAALQILSNVAGEKNPFDIAITGQALSFTEDSDGDGLNDASEFQLAAMGFDWQVAQIPLVNTYYAAAGGAGLLTQAQIQAQNGSVPLIRRNPNTGAFALTIGVEKSTTLQPGGFQHFPMTAPLTSIVDGKAEFQFISPEDEAFFRLSAE